MFGPGVPEIVIILIVVLLLFGPSRLPGLGKGVGEAIGGFRKAMSGNDKQYSETGREQTTPRV